MVVLVFGVKSSSKRSWEILERSLYHATFHRVGIWRNFKIVVLHAQPLPYGLEKADEEKFPDAWEAERTRLATQSKQILKKAREICIKTIEEISTLNRVVEQQLRHPTIYDILFKVKEGDVTSVLERVVEKHHPDEVIIGKSMTGDFSTECYRHFRDRDHGRAAVVSLC